MTNKNYNPLKVLLTEDSKGVLRLREDMFSYPPSYDPNKLYSSQPPTEHDELDYDSVIQQLEDDPEIIEKTIALPAPLWEALRIIAEHNEFDLQDTVDYVVHDYLYKRY